MGYRPRDPIQCRGCREDHLLRNCRHRKENTRNINNIEEDFIIEDVARTIPETYATLQDHQEYHQSVLVEIEGTIAKQYISILNDLGSSHGYVTPQVVENFSLKKCKHSKSWLV